MRPVRLIAILALAGALLAGCGSSSDESSGTGTNASAPAGAAKTSTAPPIGATAYGCKDAPGVRQLRVAGAGCASARGVAASWVAKRACQASTGASRTSCAVDGWRCLGARTDQGIAVTCAQRGRSLSFVARPERHVDHLHGG